MKDSKQQQSGQQLTVMQDIKNRRARAALHKKVDEAARGHKARINAQLPVTKKTEPNYFLWLQNPANRALMDEMEDLRRELVPLYRESSKVKAKRLRDAMENA